MVGQYSGGSEKNHKNVLEPPRGGGGGALSKAGLVEPGGDDGDDGDLSMASLASSVATSALEEPLVETTSPLLLCPIT